MFRSQTVIAMSVGTSSSSVSLDAFRSYYSVSNVIAAVDGDNLISQVHWTGGGGGECRLADPVNVCLSRSSLYVYRVSSTVYSGGRRSFGLLDGPIKFKFCGPLIRNFPKKIYVCKILIRGLSFYYITESFDLA